MSVRTLGPTTRRGLVVALAGLAVWLLAIVLAAYSADGAIAASDGRLSQVAIETMQAWRATPGVGALELVAYGGLAIAAAALAYSVSSRPALGSVSSTVRRRSDDVGFEFDSARNRQSGRTRSVGLGGVDYRLPSTSSADWIEELLGASAEGSDEPRGDFLRGGSTATVERTPERVPAAARTGAGVIGDGRGPELDAPGKAAEEVDGTVPSQGDTGPDPLDADGDMAADGVDAAGDAEADTVERPTVEASETAEPAIAHLQPTDRLAVELSDARETIRTVSNRLSMATGDRSAPRAERTVSAIVAEADGVFTPLRALDAGHGVDIDDAVAGLRKDHRGIEAAFRAAFSTD